jgi:hypothetical protein
MVELEMTCSECKAKVSALTSNDTEKLMIQHIRKTHIGMAVEYWWIDANGTRQSAHYRTWMT